MLIIDRSAEAKLVEMLSEIREHSESWTAIVFHLDQLMEQYRSDYQLKIAVNLVHDLLAGNDGRIFQFADGAMAVLASRMSPVLANKLIFQLRYLCMDDPLAYSEDGQENPDFCTFYYLGTDWQKCLNFATRRMTLAARGQKAEEPLLPGAVKGQFNPHRLAGIERDLGQVNLSLALRRQPVCATTGNGSIRRVFDELYINMQHLRQLLKADVDFLSNKWLFRYLTQILDERVMAIIRRDAARQLAHPVSVNIHVEALLSGWFAEFDAALTPAHKVALVFEVPIVDVFADMAAFAYARDQLQSLGYRICIDGLTADSFRHVNRELLRADLMKLQWNADDPSALSSPENRALAKAIGACGANRVILCRCDNENAVAYGQALGLSLFQGRYLDKLLNPQATVNN